MIMNRSYEKRSPKKLTTPVNTLSTLFSVIPKTMRAPFCMTWVRPTETTRQASTSPRSQKR